ncbi:MAG: hypothetical protein MSA09_12350 [Lachnospiraceae bacterium]|nr:hypothetical protein [Lachnospiraceae bacterium]MDY5517916.1 hypothetical protein [Lachnospiraceae bacterium]
MVCLKEIRYTISDRWYGGFFVGRYQQKATLLYMQMMYDHKKHQKVELFMTYTEYCEQFEKGYDDVRR